MLADQRDFQIMGRAVVNIRHVTWRDGRPRFIPGPALRKAGHAGRDLRHGADGPWYTLDEAQDWSADFCQSLQDAPEKAKRRGRPAGPDRDIRKSARHSNLPLVADLFEAWFASPRFQGREAADGRRRRKPYSANSVKLHIKMARHIEREAPKLWHSPVASVATHHCDDLYDTLDEALGLSVSAACMSTLSGAFAFGLRKNMARQNPVKGLTIERPEPNMRIGSIEEMEHLIATADRLGWHEMGDSILLGLLTAQRQDDRLNLVEAERTNGWITLKQRKTGMLVSVPELPQLTARLDANRERARQRKVNWPGIITHETRGRPFADGGEDYRKRFLALIAEAVKDMPSLSDFRDKHLRKTAVTWLANAGCSLPDICEITGHTEKSVYQIIRHYLGRDPERASRATGKLADWLEAKGARFGVASITGPFTG